MKRFNVRSNALAPFAWTRMIDSIFGVRNNEIFLFSQPRPLRSPHAGDGWTPETVLSNALPMLKADFYDLDCSSDVFTWDPV